MSCLCAIDMNNTNRPRVLDGAPWPLLPGIGIFVSSSWFGALGFEFPMGFLGWLCLVVMCPGSDNSSLNAGVVLCSAGIVVVAGLLLCCLLWPWVVGDVVGWGNGRAREGPSCLSVFIFSQKGTSQPCIYDLEMKFCL